MKKGFAWATLILLAIAAVILLYIVFTKIVPLQQSYAKKGLCSTSLKISELSKGNILGIGAKEPECIAKKMTITKKMLDEQKEAAGKKIEEYYDTNSPAKNEYQLPPSSQDKYKWAIRKIVADEVMNCFDAGGRGEKWNSVPYSSSRVSRDMYLCILCTRVKFDVKNLFNEIMIMEPWLKANTRIREKQSYYDSLIKDSASTQKMIVDEMMFNTQDTLAVLYTVNFRGQGNVLVTHYSEITTKLNRNLMLPAFFSTELEDERVVPAKCGAIIGDIQSDFEVSQK